MGNQAGKSIGNAGFNPKVAGANPFELASTSMAGAGAAGLSSADMYQRMFDMLSGPDKMKASTPAFAGPISSRMKNYINPWEEDVVGAATSDINRLAQMRTNDVAGEASMAGAFGGDRHGVMEGETNRAALDAIARTSADLRSEGFQTAGALAGQDIQNLEQHRQYNAGARDRMKGTRLAGIGSAAGGLAGLMPMLAGLGDKYYGVGKDITQQQGSAGDFFRQIAQQVMGGAGQQFDQFSNQPANSLDLMLKSLGLNPMSQTGTTTQTTQPGLWDFLSLGAQGLGAWRGA